MQTQTNNQINKQNAKKAIANISHMQMKKTKYKNNNNYKQKQTTKHKDNNKDKQDKKTSYITHKTNTNSTHTINTKNYTKINEYEQQISI